jgi:hypothetical protein
VDEPLDECRIGRKIAQLRDHRRIEGRDVDDCQWGAVFYPYRSRGIEVLGAVSEITLDGIKQQRRTHWLADELCR